jgi:hypothetical protein
MRGVKIPWGLIYHAGGGGQFSIRGGSIYHFDLDNIEEAEERYIRQLKVLNDFDSNIEFSELGSSDKEEIDSDVDTVLADIAKWSDPLRPI